MVRTEGSVGLPLLLSCAASLATAQPAQKPEPPVFGANIALVAVPVFVTDKSGKAVRGLTAEDFEIEDGGKRVPIVAFQAVDADAPATAESQAELPVAMQAAAPRQFLLLIDLHFSPAAGLYFGRKAAIAFVRDALAPGDLVAVATSSRSGLQMLTNFTSDHANAARAIEGKGIVATLGSDPLGLSGELMASGGSASLADQELAGQDALLKEAQQGLLRHDITVFLENLSKLVQLLSPLRGRKQIVLLSAGFSDAVFSSPEGTPLLAKMREIFREAGQSDVVIHTVNLTGIRGPIDVASRTGRDDSLDTGGPPPNLKSVVNRGSNQGTLVTLAQSTGGRFILPTNDFGKALREVDQISRHSYVIAFEADPAAKGNRPRTLKVRVRGSGLSVSHRTTYTAPAPWKASDARAVQLQAGEAIAKGLSGGALRLHLTTLPYRDREGKASVHAVLQIDGPALGEAAQGAALVVQVYGYVMDAGRVLDSLALNTSMDLSKFGAAVKSSGIRVLTAFPASRAAMDLRFFVRTGTSGVTGSIQRNVAVPAFVEGEPVLSTPMFTLPLAGKVVVPFQPQNRPRIEIPFHLGSEPFVPDASVALTPGRARDACVFVWRARPGSTPLEVTGEIARLGEAPVPLRIEGAPRVFPDPDGFERYVVTVVPPQAARGTYTLRLTFGEPGTGSTTRSETGVFLEK